MPRIAAWCRKCEDVTRHELHIGQTTNTIGTCVRCGEHHGACSPNYREGQGL